MDFIRQLTRFGVPLLGRGRSVAMTYYTRGSSYRYVTQSISQKGTICCVTTALNSPWFRTGTSTANLLQGSTGYTQTLYRAVSQATAITLSSPANSVSGPASVQVPHHRARDWYKRRGAILSLPLSAARQFSTTSRVSCSAIIPSSIMADRDILPAIVKPSHYDLSISSLNFNDWSYQGHVS